jgi:5-methylcytosine-specific restriction endonuclease McrA
MLTPFKSNYDTLTTGPERGPEFYRARHMRRKGLRQSTGEGRLGRLRETSKYKQASIADILSNRLDRCVTNEFHFYEWNVLTLCAYCHTRLSKRTVTRDHVIPQSKGGPTTPDNLVPACSRCNHLKANKPLWKFLLERQRPDIRGCLAAN